MVRIPSRCSRPCFSSPIGRRVTGNSLRNLLSFPGPMIWTCLDSPSRAAILAVNLPLAIPTLAGRRVASFTASAMLRPNRFSGP